MKHKLLILFTSISLSLQADVIIYYFVDTDVGDSWTGEILVSSLDANTRTALSISANEGEPRAVSDFGSGTGQVSWRNEDDWAILSVYSFPLYNAIYNDGAWDTPWSALLENRYAISEELWFFWEPVGFDNEELSGLGGEISFSLIPEPGTLGLLSLGGLTLLLRRRQTAI